MRITFQNIDFILTEHDPSHHHLLRLLLTYMVKMKVERSACENSLKTYTSFFYFQRMSRYMSRFYGLSKDATQKLLDLAVEDNLIKLENKVGTKGTKSGVEERAYRFGH